MNTGRVTFAQGYKKRAPRRVNIGLTLYWNTDNGRTAGSGKTTFQKAVKNINKRKNRTFFIFIYA